MRLSRESFDRCRPCGRWEMLPVISAADDGVETGNGFIRLGRDFTQQCKNAAFLWLGAVTTGQAVTIMRDRLASTADAAICDAVASECADAAMDALCRLARSELRRQGLALSSRRFSPGYGDMPLALQKLFYSVLNMAEMELDLTAENFFEPEKTVTAFAFVHTLQERLP